MTKSVNVDLKRHPQTHTPSFSRSVRAPSGFAIHVQTGAHRDAGASAWGQASVNRVRAETPADAQPSWNDPGLESCGSMPRLTPGGPGPREVGVESNRQWRASCGCRRDSHTRLTPQVYAVNAGAKARLPQVPHDGTDTHPAQSNHGAHIDIRVRLDGPLEVVTSFRQRISSLCARNSYATAHEFQR